MNIVGRLAILVDVVADIVMLRGETSGIPLAISLFAVLVPAFVGAWQPSIADESREDSQAAHVEPGNQPPGGLDQA